ncbi:MAG TPA: LPS assembly protein LptD [Thermoanaerobaculia bacterium]|jgi:LPS-assembly protein|nr:LPS assembly protein LptD [Thermoanaerobaculia bacterium]
MTPRRIALCLTLLFAVSAFAQKPNFKFFPGPKPGGGEVTVTLDEKTGEVEAQKDEYSIFQGGVTITYQDIKLRADKVTFNQKTRDVVAEGHVIIDQGPTRLTANQAIYNLTSKTGTFFNATGTMDPAMYFSGDRIEKVDEDTYRMTNGVFTSCDLDRPAWSFQVGHADVTLDDYARMRDISFRARGLPIFWAPRLIWPTKRERSQGLLIPRARFSDKFGARLQNGYFLPMGESVDATLYGDISTERYFGAGIDLRYVPSENIKIGDLRAYAVNNAPRNRIEWKYQYRHAQENLPGGFRGVVDIQDYSDLNFFREYDDDPRVLTQSNIYSSAYLTKNKPTYSLNILSDRRDYELLVRDTNDEDGDGNTTELTGARQRYEQLPSLQLRMYPQRVGRTPLYFSLESSSSRLRSGTVIGGERTIDADYYRTDLFPTMSMRLNTPAWLSIKPTVSVRQTWYSASREASTNQVIDDESVSRFYAQGQVDVVGPSFSKVFNKKVGGFSRFKHVIEPRFRYVRTTDINDQDRVIRFDSVDTPFVPIVQDSVEYSLTQRIIGKEANETGNAREVLSFSLRQSVALSDPFPRAGSSGSTAEEHKFTPLAATLRFNPYQSTTLDATALFGNESHQLDQVSVSGNLIGSGKFADKHLGFSYFARLEQPGFPNSDSSQVRLNTGSFLIKDRLRADVEVSYDAKLGEFLDYRYLTGWTGSCYGIALEYRQYRVFGSSDEDSLSSYGIAVTLKNVGTIGSN